jgi:hypothetical protein
VLIVPSTPSGSRAARTVGQLIGVDEPLGIEPVGQVDLLLHRPAVEGPYGKPLIVNTYRSCAARKAAELLERLRRGERPRRLRREPQPDAERPARRHALAHRHEVALEVRAHLAQLSPG